MDGLKGRLIGAGRRGGMMIIDDGGGYGLGRVFVVVMT